MKDLIAYIPDLVQFRIECLSIADSTNNPLKVFVDKDEEGNLIFVMNKTPVHYNGNESLSLIRIPDNQITKLESFGFINIIGECVNDTYTFNNNNDKNTYERVRGELIVNYLDDEGEPQIYNKPYMIGVFA